MVVASILTLPFYRTVLELAEQTIEATRELLGTALQQSRGQPLLFIDRRGQVDDGRGIATQISFPSCSFPQTFVYLPHKNSAVFCVKY